MDFVENIEAKAEAQAWAEYDRVAMDCAKRGVKGNDGDELPPNMNARTVELINDDPEAFRQRVRDSAYALAMSELLTGTSEAD